MTRAQPPGHVAKSSSAWTDADLSLCNLKIVDTDVPTFFGIDRLPAPSISPAVLNMKATHSQQPMQTQIALTNEERLFFQHLQAASTPSPDQETAVRDFTAHLLHLLGYTEPKPSAQHSEQASDEPRVIKKDYDLPLFMCGRTVHALADVCLLVPDMEHHHSDTVLLIAKASRTGSSPTTDDTAAGVEARLIAQAIAAYQSQNRTRGRARLSPTEKHTVPGLIMAGTMPVLYKIEISGELAECVQTAQVPTTTTKVQRLIMPGEGPAREGMIRLENRKVMLGCLEAFKALI
ncbi:hypothetical protein LshimejAT787_1002310 [Lyophyllum shimeji]|uniref:Uncharacterized protein n=1 Tax=Lyophyllum shimeji TaxID=47721 RepID=A0A9P3PTX8_LYOSH|nr:hypothetical protein LshimejAT787_1002310 [Lyophyllum shimeji]